MKTEFTWYVAAICIGHISDTAATLLDEIIWSVVVLLATSTRATEITASAIVERRTFVVLVLLELLL